MSMVNQDFGGVLFTGHENDEECEEVPEDTEPDYGGAVDCMGNVFSDADPGL